jgi:hypothetical protein
MGADNYHWELVGRGSEENTALLRRRAEIAEGKIFDALTLMEDWDGVQFSQIRDVLTGGAK